MDDFRVIGRAYKAQAGMLFRNSGNFLIVWGYAIALASLVYVLAK